MNQALTMACLLVCHPLLPSHAHIIILARLEDAMYALSIRRELALSLSLSLCRGGTAYAILSFRRCSCSCSRFFVAFSAAAADAVAVAVSRTYRGMKCNGIHSGYASSFGFLFTTPQPQKGPVWQGAGRAFIPCLGGDGLGATARLLQGAGSEGQHLPTYPVLLKKRNIFV